MHTQNPDKFVAVPVEAFSPGQKPLNEVQKRLQAILDYWGPNGEMWLDDFGECDGPRCALGVVDQMRGNFEGTPEATLLEAVAIEMGFTGDESGNYAAADCSDSSFANARKMVMRAITLAGDAA